MYLAKIRRSPHPMTCAMVLWAPGSTWAYTSRGLQRAQLARHPLAAAQQPGPRAVVAAGRADNSFGPILRSWRNARNLSASPRLLNIPGNHPGIAQDVTWQPRREGARSAASATDRKINHLSWARGSAGGAGSFVPCR